MVKVIAYLGSSAPVHVTHMRMVQTFLADGFDHIFVFLLRWSPDRFGVSADSARPH